MLRCSRLVDGTGGPPVEDAIVVLDGETIAAAGSRASTPVPPGAVVVDYTGETILPGLVSDHSHVGLVNGVAVAPETTTARTSSGSCGSTRRTE